ncbi:MAG: sigma 54-interacting transcriptional regulator [Planctomycetaceae bacterium]|jgi:transcriptional regulatory protein RtcR|nr:sigma 54-interacting transcriptional regulator [Planctomycetaceae bacterium]
MSKHKQNVVIGLVAMRDDKPDSQWRPTIHLVQKTAENGFPIHRFHLLVQKGVKKLAKQLKTEIAQLSPKTIVQLDDVESLAWDYIDVCNKLFGYINTFPFDYDKEDYQIHITTGTETVKNAWILLLTNNVFRADIIQSLNPHGGAKELYTIVDTSLLRRQIRLWQNKDTEKRLSESNQLTYKEIYEQVREISTCGDSSLCRFLLMGETGTGKTQIAKDIVRDEIKLPDDKFVDLNCAGISEQTAMSELCGYVKGAFTGAEKDTGGKLKLADGGVLFLDEIGELPLSVQAMLLRCIEDKEFYQVGGSKKIKTDFRLFCATNKNLQKEVAEGRFRKDLFYRIKLWPYFIPPLREQIKNRGDELVRKKEEEKSVKFENGNVRQFFVDFAEKAEWQGNYRDFNDIFTRMAFRAKGTPNSAITQDIVESEIELLKIQWDKESETLPTDSVVSFPENVFDPTDYQNDIYYQRLCEMGKENFKGKYKHPIHIIQLLAVLRCCKDKNNGADAGKILYESGNLSSQVIKFLEHFGLNWQDVKKIIG